MSTNVVIFAQPDAELMTKIGICTQYCIEAGYEAVAVVRGAWKEAEACLDSGEAELIVAAGADDVPTQRLPRVEIVNQMREHARDVYRRRRAERAADADDSRRRRPRPIL